MDAQSCPLMLSICLVIVHYLSSQYLVDKTLADYYLSTKSIKVFSQQSFVLYGILKIHNSLLNLANYKHHNYYKQQPTQ